MAQYTQVNLLAYDDRCETEVGLTVVIVDALGLYSGCTTGEIDKYAT